ncbi:MAG: class I SAM-dependent methyltransferase [Polyangiaceae bacterium]|nr:class I SAM-dependent methyltransferase [Polyangiaceae bacterium]
MTSPRFEAESYARWRATVLGGLVERTETEVVFGLAGPLDGRRVLDVGAGDGTYALEAAARGAQVTALDAEQGMLDAARARAERRGVQVELQRGRAEDLPLAAGSFDVVLAITVLCFVPAAQLAVREMARVLAPGGRLVLGELGRHSVWAAERRMRGWLGSETWRGAQFWSRRELEELVRDADLRVADVRGAVFFPPSARAARVMARFEPLLTRHHAPGAAFLALAADKPRR